MRRALLFSSWLALACLGRAAWAQTTTLVLDEAVVAPRARIGLGVNGGGSWYDFVGAILVDDPSFEGPEDENGFARDGWPWFVVGALTARVDRGDHVGGQQSQQVTVTAAPASIGQGRTALPQLPHVMQARAGHTYRIRVQVRSDAPGARIRLGVVDEGWNTIVGPELAVTDSWQVVEWDYEPAADHLLRGVAVEFDDVATYWIDDLVAWDVGDLDPATGLSATFVERLRELRPATLRLGGLGVNGIPLESYLRQGQLWDLDYGPPALQPDLDLTTFLRLCREVGAQPFITVPPAFSDATSCQLGDLTDEVIAGAYADHGNLVDYLGGDATTVYGARREADGFTRWDLEFDTIYLELGNELWGTPDDRWDMDPTGGESQEQQMLNYATYCERRMTEMRSRPGWRENMRVGFGGRDPTIWLGGWPGSYDGTLVPAIGALSDFSTIDLYYGEGTAADGDEALFAALFASAAREERNIGALRAAFRAANGGVDLDTISYEGNATWGGYEPDLSSPSPLYFRSVSLGAAVSLVDLYAAANRAGVSVINHFHYGGNVWGATGPYPEVRRKPAFDALALLARHLSGDMVGCTVEGGGTWDDALTGETQVPFVACYPYRDGDAWYVLVVNRHRSEPRDVLIQRRLAPMQRISLTGPDILANDETAETIALRTDTLQGELVDEITDTIPPFSAVVLVLSETGEMPPDGDADADADADGDADGDGDGDADADADAGTDADAEAGSDEGCACAAPGAGRDGGWAGGWFAGAALAALAALLRRRAR